MQAANAAFSPFLVPASAPCRWRWFSLRTIWKIIQFFVDFGHKRETFPAVFLPSSLSVNRPIWGKSLKVSKQMTPAARSLAMHTCSCFTKRGRILLFSPVFLSTRQIKACRWDIKKSTAVQRNHVLTQRWPQTQNWINTVCSAELTVICTSSMQVWMWRTAL